MSRHRPSKREVEERKRRKKREKLGSRAAAGSTHKRRSRRGPQSEGVQLTAKGRGWIPQLSGRHLADLRKGKMTDLTKDHFGQTDHSRSDIAGGVLVFDVVPKALGTTSRALGSFRVDLRARTIERVERRGS